MKNGKEPAARTKARELELRTALGKIPLCGCGSSDKMWQIVEAMLDRAADHETKGSFYDPMPDLELSGTAVEFAAQVLDTSGMTEHGGGIGWAWLTEPGKLVLLFLRKYGHDTDKWPEYSQSSSGNEEFMLSDEDWHQRTMTHGANLKDETIP